MQHIDLKILGHRYVTNMKATHFGLGYTMVNFEGNDFKVKLSQVAMWHAILAIEPNLDPRSFLNAPHIFYITLYLNITAVPG